MDDLTRLALAAGTGDHVATRELIERTQPQIWQLCSYLGSGGDTDDLVQDTFVRALKSLPGYRGDAPVQHWLFAIARRVCADEVRRRTRSRRALRRLSSMAQESSVDAITPADDLTPLLQRLDPDRREAFVLTQLLGLRYDEAAEVCACAIGTIRSRVARARAQLVQLARDQQLTS